MTAAQAALAASFLFGPGNMVSALLISHGKKAGWAVMVAVQLGMMAFGAMTGYWGFVMNAGMVVMGVYGYVRWRRGGSTAPGGEEADGEKDRAGAEPAG